MVRIWKAGTASLQRSACLHEKFAGCTSRRYKCRSYIHALLVWAKHAVSFLYDCLRRSNDHPSCSSYKKNETNPLKTRALRHFHLGSVLGACSANMETTFLAIWRLPSIKHRGHSPKPLFVKHGRHAGSLHTKKDRIAATKKRNGNENI